MVRNTFPLAYTPPRTKKFTAPTADTFDEFLNHFDDPVFVLAAAILRGAVSDLRLPKYRSASEHAADARAFFQSDWFLTICAALNLEPLTIRRRLHLN